MTKIVRCTCGIELRSADETDLINQVRRHAKEAHDLDLNDEQIRAMMEIEQLPDARRQTPDART